MAFNWREYIRVEEVPQRYFDAEGKVRPEYNDMRGRLESERINLRLITAVLDQVSQIPEVQTLIQDGVRIAHVRWLQFRDLDGGPIPEDRRLEISAVGGSKGNFFQMPNVITLSPEATVALRYISEDNSPAPFSLQHAIIHELGHAADTRLTPANDLKRGKANAEKALQALLKDFPEYASEYQSAGTVAGIPAWQIHASKNHNEFQSHLDNLSMAAGISTTFKGDNLKEAVLQFAKRYDKVSNPKEVVSLYFQNAFKRINEANADSVDELPIVEKTNAIMKKYFGEPERKGYVTVRERLAISSFHDEDRIKFSELLLKHTYCQFKPGTSITYTPHPDLDMGNLFAPSAARSSNAQEPAQGLNAKGCKIPLS